MSNTSSTESQQSNLETTTTSANNIKNSNESDTESSTDSNHKLIGGYEQSVTDKENALMHTFSNLLGNNLIASSPAQSTPHTVTNGKLLDFTHTLNDGHENAKTSISNGNGHTLIDTLDNKM